MITKRKRKPHPDTFTVMSDVQLLEKDGEYYYHYVGNRSKKFEYRIEVIPKSSLPDPLLVKQWLNDLGKDGWELVESNMLNFNNDTKVGAIFKREVKE